MMIKVKQGQRIDTIFILMIFCVFAMSVLMVLMFSGKIYKNMHELSGEGYNEQTFLSYMWSRVKNDDKAGKIYISDFEGLPALCFDDEYDGASYQTLVYLYDGWIREMFCQTSLSLSPALGTPVIEANSFSLEQEEYGLIKVKTDFGSLLISPRGKTGLGRALQ